MGFIGAATLELCLARTLRKPLPQRLLPALRADSKCHDGDAAGMLDGLRIEELDDRVRLKFHAADMVGDDLRILARLAPR